MQVIHSTKIVYWDVDNTLVYSLSEYPSQRPMTGLDPRKIVFLNGRRFALHTLHCEMIRDFKGRGHTIVVWSAGGSHWAEAVVRAAELTDVVDLVINKPDWYFDDQPASRWLGEDKQYFKTAREPE